jgi:ATP-binding protein involved in chromosome partitioning
MEKIAICSAKGGVGKTTIAYSLAMKYHKAGKKIGLFDADVYGPNLINLFAYVKPNQSAHNSKITPAELPYSIDGIEFSSTDLLFNPDDAAMLRGPMLSKILKELYEKSFSTDLDYLFIDMPPGTGDAYITIFKDLNIQKAVLVYVDDPLCIADLKRTIKMLHLLEVDVVAAIENLAESKQTLTNDEIIALDINKTLAIPRIARHDLYNKYLRTGKLEKLLPETL